MRGARGPLLRLMAIVLTAAACSSGASPREAPAPPGAAGPGAASAGSAGAAAAGGAIDTEALFAANNRGAALMEQYKPAQALEEFAKVTTLAPGWAPGQANLGLAAFYARQMDRAEQAFREVIRLDASLVAGHYGLATLEKGQGQSAEALAEFEAAQKLDPKDADILYNIGLLHGRQRQFDRAIEALRQAREIDPNNMSVRYQLARAYLQSGKTAEGEKEMAVYQKLAANPKFAVPTGNQYGEAGRYALVITDYAALVPAAPPAPAVAVRFRDAAAGAGVAFRHAGPGGEAKPGDAARLGSGVAVGDLDGDGLPDLVFANAAADGKAAPPAILRNKGKGMFEDVTTAAGVTFASAGLGAALADYDNDGDLDLSLTGQRGLALYRNDGRGAFKEVTAGARASVAGLLAGAAWGDLDHDGDLDLIVTRPAPPPGKARVVLLRNSGDGGFEDATATLPVKPGSGGAIGAVFSDLDLDRDLDVVVAGAGGPDVLLDNRREEGFADTGARAGLRAAGGGRGVAVGDVNGDGRPDLVFPAAAPESPALFLGTAGGGFARRDLPPFPGGSAYGAVLFDADNDGDLDLYLAGSGQALLLNDGKGAFSDGGPAAGLAAIPVKDGRGAAAADLDGDGDLDLVVSTNGGRPLLLRNDTPSQNRWVEIAPRGLNSNRQAVGTKVEVQAGPAWQRREVTAGSGYLSSSAVPLHAGLGSRPVADVVRLVWPGGVLQAELDVSAGQRLEPQELDRKGSSCPLLFAWDGGGWRFITDVLGVGGLGMWLAPGKYGTPVPDESLLIPSTWLQPLDGAYYFQMLENLEEVTYLDAAKLQVIDHPKDVEVYPNMNFGGATPRGTPRLYAVDRAARVFPARATDHHGRSVTDRLLKVDRTYPDEFRKLSLAGYAEMHDVTLEFPSSILDQEGLVLFLNGWTDFEYSSSNYAAYQQELTMTLPVLEMEDADGVFKPVLEPMGFPPGMARTIAVDLASLGPLKGRRMRLRTNMRVYWDQIFLARPFDEATMAARIQVSEAKAAAAHLHRRGFPREHSPDGKEPRLYDYRIMDNTQPFRVMTGDYTRFGRVTDLVTDADDRAVIFGKGEEVTLEFPVKGLPPQPKGTIRSFVLHLSGWCKDMDPHTAHGETVEPLPFRSMTSYPYAEGEMYPDDADHRGWRSLWNTRRLEGR